MFGNLLELSHFASLSTPQVKHFNPIFEHRWVFLFWLFSHISSKSVASISGNLAEDSIWNSESSKRWREKWGTQNKTLRAMIARWRLKAVMANLIGQYSVYLFILPSDWLVESIQIFIKLDGLFKAEGNVPAKTIQFILNLDSWLKLVKNRSVSNIGFWCSYIINNKNEGFFFFFFFFF